MELEQIKSYLEENKDNEDVQAYLGGFKEEAKFDLNTVKSKFEEDGEFKSFLDSAKDSHFNKALATWKENNLNGLIETEVRKRSPEKDEKDLAIQALEEKFATMEREKTYESLKNLALVEATEKGLPVELIEYFIGTNEEVTKGNLSKLEQVFNSKLEDSVKNRLKDTSYTPPKSSNKSYSTEDFGKMTYTEKMDLLKTNPEAYKSLTK